MSTMRDFAAANAKSLARLALQQTREVMRWRFTYGLGILSAGYHTLEDANYHAEKVKSFGYKDVTEPISYMETECVACDTDWHEEAQMYHNVIGKVRDFCDTDPHQFTVKPKPFLTKRDLVGHGNDDWPCECIECQVKRRILVIIAKGLK